MDDESEIEFERGGDAIPAAAAPRALVAQDDSALARICVRVLARLGMKPHVVWTREEANELLSRPGAPIAFACADARLLGAGADDVAAQLRRLRPGTPFVVASGSLCDVLAADAVVLCKPFDADQFQAAFDASLFHDVGRLALLDAAEALRAADAAEAAAPTAGAVAADAQQPLLPLSA